MSPYLASNFANEFFIKTTRCDVSWPRVNGTHLSARPILAESVRINCKTDQTQWSVQKEADIATLASRAWGDTNWYKRLWWCRQISIRCNRIELDQVGIVHHWANSLCQNYNCNYYWIKFKSNKAFKKNQTNIKTVNKCPIQLTTVTCDGMSAMLISDSDC